MIADGERLKALLQGAQHGSFVMCAFYQSARGEKQSCLRLRCLSLFGSLPDGGREKLPQA